MIAAADRQTVENKRERGRHLATLFPNRSCYSFEEALAAADAANRVLASNKRLTQALVLSEEWKILREVFSATWAGTMFAYIEPDKPFREAAEKIGSLGSGHFLVFVNPHTSKRTLFPIPEEYLDKGNAILVAEHPDYRLEIEGNDRIVRAAQVDIVERFPAENGWYTGDPKHDIPCILNDIEGFRYDFARFLVRAGRAVGPVFRCRHEYCDGPSDSRNRRTIHLGGGTMQSDMGLNLAVEAEESPASSLMVEWDQKEHGVLIARISLEAFRAVVGNANHDLQDLLQTVEPEKLTGVRRLLQALEIK